MYRQYHVHLDLRHTIQDQSHSDETSEHGGPVTGRRVRTILEPQGANVSGARRTARAHRRTAFT